MKKFYNGKWIEVQVDSLGRVNSDQLRHAAEIPADRAMVLQRPNGQNVIVAPHSYVIANEDDSFCDAPLTVRG